MILCFDVDRETKDKMDNMIRSGDYRDYSELLTVSISNQHLLHNSHSGHTDVALPIAPEQGLVQVPNIPEVTAPSQRPDDAPVPGIFRLRVGGPKIEVAAIPNDAFLPGMEVPVDRWLFGQHNKLLPAKANVRALLNLLHSEKAMQGVVLDEAAREIAGYAATLGDTLRELDIKFQRSRDDAMAVAFPSSDSSNSDKSRLRYANQFVGSVSKEGRMTGLLVDLKLVNIDRHKPPRVRLTQPGLSLAELRNPVLDSEDDTSTKKFSEAETDFLIDHIWNHLPVEVFAFTATLSAISSGDATPESLDLALKKYLPNRADKPFTDAFLTTQRAGVISRMADLGLVSRTRSGPNVTYVVNIRGAEFLKRGL
jgi:hypothetical protein